jgi:hypothetical protein
METKNRDLRHVSQKGGINWGIVGLVLFVAAVGATLYGLYQIDPAHIHFNGKTGEDLTFFEMLIAAVLGVFGLIIGLIAGLIGLIVGLLGAALGIFIALGVVTGPILLLVFTIWIFTRGGKRDPVATPATPSEPSTE